MLATVRFRRQFRLIELRRNSDFTFKIAQIRLFSHVTTEFCSTPYLKSWPQQGMGEAEKCQTARKRLENGVAQTGFHLEPAWSNEVGQTGCQLASTEARVVLLHITAAPNSRRGGATGINLSILTWCQVADKWQISGR